MKIYTKRGDAGDTSRLGGLKVRKSDPICHVLGGIDELNAAIGWCLQAGRTASLTGASGSSDAIVQSLIPLQGELLAIGSAIAAAGTTASPKLNLDEATILRMERDIDEAVQQMPPLTHFIIPGGTELACRVHMARTICRRSERSLVAAMDAGLSVNPIIEKYINRLSDLLFTLARLANFAAGVPDQVWMTT